MFENKLKMGTKNEELYAGFRFVEKIAKKACKKHL